MWLLPQIGGKVYRGYNQTTYSHYFICGSNKQYLDHYFSIDSFNKRKHSSSGRKF